MIIRACDQSVASREGSSMVQTVYYIGISYRRIIWADFAFPAECTFIEQNILHSVTLYSLDGWRGVIPARRTLPSCAARHIFSAHIFCFLLQLKTKNGIFDQQLSAADFCCIRNFNHSDLFTDPFDRLCQ